MTKLLRASVLVLALSASALADDGIMQGGKTPPPPPPPTTSATQSSDEPTVASDGIMQTGLAETAVQVSLSVLQALALV
jgi:hypothetical protein